MRDLVSDAFDKIEACVIGHSDYLLDWGNDEVNYTKMNKVINNAIQNNLQGEEYVAYLSATNPYKDRLELKENRNNLITKAREILIDELDDIDRVDNKILKGLI